MQTTWWLYVLECRNGVLYTGIAKDVEARFAAHLNGTGAMFTRLNRPVRILGKAAMPTRSAALRAEYALKQIPRAEKLRWCAENRGQSPIPNPGRSSGSLNDPS